MMPTAYTAYLLIYILALRLPQIVPTDICQQAVLAEGLVANSNVASRTLHAKTDGPIQTDLGRLLVAMRNSNSVKSIANLLFHKICT
jgi:hypothetical protein